MLLLKWLELRLLIINYALEIYIGAIALIFTVLGIWLALKIANRKTQTVVIEKPVYHTPENFILNATAVTGMGLSPRELEVLQLMAGGCSNQEIADKLFVSLNTVKTHSSKVFEKMQVGRRTQAVEKARRLGIVP